MGDLISFDGVRKRYYAQGAPPQAQATKANIGRFPDNQHTRRACVQMLLFGGSFRAVAKKHPGREEGLAQDVRDAILGGGRAA